MSKQDVKPFPTMLNKSDAMLYAANNLDEMVSNMKLIKLIADMKGEVGKSDNPELLQAMKDLGIQSSGIIDVNVQEQAMKAASLEIRAMANEAKLADARASNAGSKNYFAV